MSNIWITSDTHFSHANILKFRDSEGNLIRGALFSSVEEMDDIMIENWNRVVKPGDKVYHLGDVYMGGKENFDKLWSRLNGSKRLIVGNHDDIKFFTKGNYFAKISMLRMFPEFGLMLSHVPLHEQSLNLYPKKDDVLTWDQSPKALLNIHGHVHQNPSPPGPYRCVCVEQINYTPINIEELRIK